jgi:hypothetical protein
MSSNQSIGIPPGQRSDSTDSKKPKARIHTWLAWQDEPGKPLGQAISAHGTLTPDLPAANVFAGWLDRDILCPMTAKNKLIEVALPLEAINIASAREKSIRHGHPSTLHLWWARRPLAAARAVIVAQMVDDPSAHPDIFPTEKKQEKERQRLFRIIEDLVKWENTTNETVLQQARDEIWQSWRYTCAENADHPRAKELFDRYRLPAFHERKRCIDWHRCCPAKRPTGWGHRSREQPHRCRQTWRRVGHGNPRWFSPPLYGLKTGLKTYGDLFTPRQLVALTTFSDLVQEARERVKRDALGARASGPPEAQHKGWHSRGYHPHLDAPDILQSITFRLHDSVPAELIADWRDDHHLHTLRRYIRENAVTAGLCASAEVWRWGSAWTGRAGGPRTQEGSRSLREGGPGATAYADAVGVYLAFPVTIYYAFKQAESDGADGTTNTGWDTFLAAVIKAGFAITGTWPMTTELARPIIGSGTNALASSIVLVCRQRSANAPTATRRDFVTALKAELPQALAHLQAGNIAPVDLAQAAIGPGMAVYTRYAKVLDAEGKPLPVRAALALINQTLDEALAEQEGDFDADSRWALTWFEQTGFAEGDYGVAEQLSKSKNTSVGGLDEAGILVY